MPILLDIITNLIPGVATLTLCLAANTKARGVDVDALGTVLVFDNSLVMVLLISWPE